MNLLLNLSLRGSLVILIVLSLDRFFGGAMRASGRRAWWRMVPLAFLLPLQVAVFQQSQTVGIAREFGPAIFRTTSSVLALPATGDAAAPIASHWAWIWLAGAMVNLALLAWGTWRVTRQWSGETSSSDAELLELLKECKQQLGIKIHVRLVVSSRVLTPAILGWFRPCVLLPKGLVSSLPRRELRGVLLHELAHCRSCDVPLNWLFSIVQAVHWFNPLAHLALWGWNRFREEAADEMAIRFLGESAGEIYGEALIHTLRQGAEEAVPFGALAMVESFRDLKRRARQIKQCGGKTSRAMPAATVSLVLLCWIFLRPTTAAHGNRPDVGCPVSNFMNQHIEVK